MNYTKMLVVLFFIVGLVLLGVMVARVGLDGVRASSQAMGLWLLPYMLLSIVPFVLHALGWRCCFPSGPRPPQLWRLMVVDRAGSAINRMTPTATIGGDVVKALLLEPVVPRGHATMAVVIDKTSSTLAKMGFLGVGLLYLAQYSSLPDALQWSLSVSIGLIVLGLVGFIAFQRWGALSKLLNGVAELVREPGWLQRLKPQVMSLDSQFATYYTDQRWRFMLALLCHFTAHTFHIVKTYVLLRFLLGDAAPGWAESSVVAIAVMALDQMFFFVPGRIGTLEGARFVVFTALGRAEIYGLAFGLIARAEHLVWNGIGLLA